MAEIYKEQKELDEYIRYHELYTNVLKTKNLSLSEEYIEYSQELYEYNLLKKKEYRRDFFFFIVTLAAASVFSFIIIALIKWRQKSWTDQLTGCLLYTSWVAAEVFLFVLVGATVNIEYFGKVGVQALAVILGALVFRMLGVYICCLLYTSRCV